MMPTRKQINEFLFRPVDGSSLGLFRIFFGLFMLWRITAEFPLIGEKYGPQMFHFTYQFWGFVQPWPGQGLQIHFIIMGLAAAGIVLGVFYRWSAVLFLITYTYVFFIDQTWYENHLYLIILLSFLLMLSRAHAWASVDAWRGKVTGKGLVPFWNIFILRAQIIVVYVFAGIAKLNSDWLRGEPLRDHLRLCLTTPPGDPVREFFWPAFKLCMKGEVPVYLLSYGGLAFDLTIGFLFLFQRTRPWAFIAAILFHLLNKFLFGISIFPWLMMAALVLFLEPETPRKAWLSIQGLFIHGKAPAETPKAVSSSRLEARGQNAVFYFLVFYLSFQILFPLRHWLVPGNLLWTEEGRNYSWHMKIRNKVADPILFWVKDPETGRVMKVDVKAHLNIFQVQMMAVTPWLTLQYAHYLRDQVQKMGIKDPIITAEIMASLNGRPFQYFIDPNVDLSDMEYPLWGAAPWIRPLDKNAPIGQYDDISVSGEGY